MQVDEWHQTAAHGDILPGGGRKELDDLRRCEVETRGKKAGRARQSRDDKSVIFIPRQQSNVKQIYAGIRLWRRHTAALESWGGEDRATAFYQMAEERCPLTIQILDDREGKPAQHF